MEADLNKIKEYCQSSFFEKENLRFWNFIKSGDFDQKKFKQIVAEVSTQVDCTQCGNCCRKMIPILEEEDIKRITAFLKLNREKFISQYLRKSEELSFSKKNKEMLEFKQQPCTFLSENKCQIYPLRPRSCREYPNLDQNLVLRCHQFFANAEVCPLVFNVLERAKREFIVLERAKREFIGLK